MKGWGRARIRWATVFALLFLACSAVPVLADLPEEGATEAALPQVPLPDAQDIAKGATQAEEEEAQNLEWLSSPEAVHEREVSQNAYANLSASESQELLNAEFAERLQALNSDPARFLSDAKLDHLFGESVAVVTGEGDTTLMDSTTPVRVPDEEGELKKVDLSLLATPNGFEPANPIVDLAIPAAGDESVELANGDLTITQVGADGDSAAHRFGDQNIFYPEVQESTDLVVSPTSMGVELFDQLRSEDSPETLRFRLGLAADATLSADGMGGAAMTLPGDQPLAHIPPPTAVDAQGTPVPVELQVEGNDIVLHVPHRERDYASPILVDPEFVMENWYTATWWSGYGIAALEDGTWQPYASVSKIHVQTWPYYATFGGSNRGLFLSGQSGSWGANQYGQWTYTVPDWDSYIDHASISPFWRDDHGCGYQTYKEPHDYVGQWDGSQWIGTVHINDARIYGRSDIGPWGKVLVIGIGSGNGGSRTAPSQLVKPRSPIWVETLGAG